MAQISSLKLFEIDTQKIIRIQKQTLYFWRRLEYLALSFAPPFCFFSSTPKRLQIFPSILKFEFSEENQVFRFFFGKLK